jgi:hypothetical protein
MYLEHFLLLDLTILPFCTKRSVTRRYELGPLAFRNNAALPADRVANGFVVTSECAESNWSSHCIFFHLGMVIDNFGPGWTRFSFLYPCRHHLRPVPGEPQHLRSRTTSNRAD